MHRFSFVLVGAVVLMIGLPRWTGAQDAVDEELQRLIARAKAEKSDALRHDVLGFQRKHPGTPAAVKAAGLLCALPSPLDRLDAKAIPELERFDWHPKETVAVLGEHRGRQAGAVTCVLFSRNGKWLASGSSNGYVRIWDSTTMRLQTTFGHGGGAYCLAASKDGSLFASGGGDGLVHFYDTTGETPKAKFKQPLKVASTPLFGLSIAPNGKMFAAGGSDSRVYLWDLTADPPKEHAGGSGHTGVVRTVVYAPGGKLVASGGDDKLIRIWSLDKDDRPKEKANADTRSGVLCLAFHPTDDKVLISGGADGIVRVWEVGAKLKEKTALKLKNGTVNAITFSASGKTVAAAFSDGTARTWGFGATLTEKAHLEGHKAAATAIAFAPDNTLIATGSADWTVRLWPGSSGPKPRDKTITRGHLSHVYTVAFNPDGAGLASGSLDASVRFWDLAAAEPKERISKMKEEGAIHTLAFSPDGKTLVSGGANVMFRTCEVDSGRFLFGFKGHTGYISRLAWSADGKQVASCGNDKTVRTWDGLTGKGKGAITAFDTYVNSVAFSPDGKQLLCTSGYYLYDKLGQIVAKDGELYYNDSTVRVYDAADLRELARWKYDKAMMHALAFSADGRTFFAGGSDTILRQWDAVKLPKEHDVFYKGGVGGITVLAPSPDGRWLAAYGPDYRIRLFDVATRKSVREWTTAEQFGYLAFAPDSRHLAISVGTGVVLILRIAEAK